MNEQKKQLLERIKAEFPWVDDIVAIDNNAQQATMAEFLVCVHVTINPAEFYDGVNRDMTDAIIQKLKKKFPTGFKKPSEMNAPRKKKKLRLELD